ncbi:hypothetical protein CSUB01_12389 [Colletotrichum sublineola]|uniref:Uncharacterized protein n=1 Tax=Colletotrichum sublineola TaxID=1173701 RepID=A0A066XQA4_COLSU|nr:hypothetical protein CSUB01_12389 [Colletotrichum sublineola]
MMDRLVLLSLRRRHLLITSREVTAEPEARKWRKDTQIQQASSYRNPSFKLLLLLSENSAQLYSNNPTSKYTGGQYKTIDLKLPTFYELCDRVGIPASGYRAAVMIMLSGDAQEYYSINLHGFTGDFNALIANIKSEFKGDKVHSARIAELRHITFESIARDHLGKSKRETLDLLIKKVTQLVRAATHNGMPKDKEYHNTLIDCCQGVPECAMALLSPPATYNALCAQLRNGVANAVLFCEPQAQHYAKEYPGHDK